MGHFFWVRATLRRLARSDNSPLYNISVPVKVSNDNTIRNRYLPSHLFSNVHLAKAIGRTNNNRSPPLTIASVRHQRPRKERLSSATKKVTGRRDNVLRHQRVPTRTRTVRHRRPQADNHGNVRRHIRPATTNVNATLHRRGARLKRDVRHYHRPNGNNLCTFPVRHR